MTVTDPDPELTHRHYFLLGVVQILVEVSPHHMNVARQGLEVVQSLLGAEIASTENVLDPARNQQLFEFRRKSRSSVGNVEVSEYKHQHCELERDCGG